MGKRGRKSAAELAIAPVIEIEPRPVAPSELTDEEAQEWDGLVARMPATWFRRETWPLLTQLCRHVIAARRFAQLMNQQTHGRAEEQAFDAIHYMKLARALAGQTATIASVSTKLRISPQSSFDRHVAGVAKRDPGDGPHPWED